MDKIKAINNLEVNLKRLKEEVSQEKMKLINEFNKKMNHIINITPTGDLRNEITELNILHQAILETIV